MSKRLRAFGAVALSGLVALVMSGGLGPRGSAEAGVLAAASTTYATGLQVVDLSDSTAANIVVQAYTSTGAQPTGWPSGGISDQVPAGSTKIYFSGNPNDKVFGSCAGCGNIPANSLVSLVVSSDQPIAASTNTQRIGGGTAGEGLGTSGNPFRLGTASAVADTQAGATVYFPQVNRKFGGFTSKAYVQNTSSTAASTTWTYFDKFGTLMATENAITIQPFSSRELDLSQVAGLPDGAGYSLIVKATDTTQKLAGVANNFGAGTDPGSSQLLSYNASSVGSLTLYAPKVDKNLGNSSIGFYTSGPVVQNIGTANTNITFQYNFGGTIVNFTYSDVGPGQAVGTRLSTGNDGTAGIPNGTGSLIVTSSSQPIIGIVNEDNRPTDGVGSGNGQGATYNMVRAEDATKTAVIPQAVNKVSNSDVGALGGVFSSGIQFQNVSGTPATCSVAFAAGGATVLTISNVAVAAGASSSTFLPNVAGLDPTFNGAAKITCDQNIVSVGNISVRSASNTNNAAGVGDSFSQNGGISR